MARHNVWIRNELEDFYKSLDNKSEIVNEAIYNEMKRQELAAQ